MNTASLFDTYVMVDWSAAALPARGADSIWSAVLHGSTGVLDVVNHPTRTEAKSMLRSLLRSSIADGHRVLVGVDIPYGYPVGTAAALGLATTPRLPPWAAMWGELHRLIEDDVGDRPNRNTRFATAAALNARIGANEADRSRPGPFWGGPVHLVNSPLSPKKLHAYPYATPSGSLTEFRHAERALRAQGMRPFSVWQLAGAGAVGSQTLMGIPVLADLVTDPQLAPRSHVWPFTTGLALESIPAISAASMTVGVVVHAEIWPGFLPKGAVEAVDHPVKDARQVTALCGWMAEHDRAGTLAALFAPKLDPVVAADVVAEEGWVLGVPGV